MDSIHSNKDEDEFEGEDEKYVNEIIQARKEFEKQLVENKYYIGNF